MLVFKQLFTFCKVPCSIVVYFNNPRPDQDSKDALLRRDMDISQVSTRKNCLSSSLTFLAISLIIWPLSIYL
jgi:hypothetical protein